MKEIIMIATSGDTDFEVLMYETFTGLIHPFKKREEEK